MNDLKKFVDSIDLGMHSAAIGQAYTDYFIDNQVECSLFFDSTKPLYFKNQTLSICSDSSSLDFITKRSLLIFEKLLVTHYVDKLDDYRTSVEPSKQYAADKVYVTYKTNKDSFLTIGDWIKKSSNLITNDIAYLMPRVEKYGLVDPAYMDAGTAWNESSSSIVDAVIQRNKIVDIQNSSIIKSKYIVPLVEVELPYIDNIDLETYSKVVIDERKSLNNFRLFLKEKFLDIESKQGSENYFQALEKLGIEIKKDLSLLSTEIQNFKRKKAFQATGAAIATTVATLLAVNEELFSASSKIIGTTGGGYLFFELLKSNFFDNVKAKESPFYFFWLLQSKL